MGKKRVRRAEISPSDRRPNLGESSTNEYRKYNSLNSSVSRNRVRSTILFLLFIVSLAISVILYRRIYTPKPVIEAELPDVYRRGLVKADISYSQVLNEHGKVSGNFSRRHFENPVLAYITPWNSKGYDLAKKFNSKLTHLSPVWYDLKSEIGSYTLEGRHNADIGWISQVRMKGNAKILPRVVLEAMPMQLLTKKRQRKVVISLIVEECKELDYDGIVLESWSRWAAFGILQNPEMRMLALQFVKQLGEAMHSVNLERNGESLLLVYVIGPPRSEQLQPHDFGPEDLLSLSSAVDGFSLMTYDFSNTQNPGPNAPLKWIQYTMKVLLRSHVSGRGLARKIFLGINFYGNDFLQSREGGEPIISDAGGPILGREYLSLLEQHKPVLKWEENSAEHYFIYSDNRRIQHVVFYPTPLSTSMRIEEARMWGAGISIWEIGQGLDYLFDLL